MKAAVFSLLLAVFLFKLGGYDALFWIVKRQIIAEQNKKLWNMAKSEEVQHVSIPMSVPYMQPRSSAAEDDFFEHNGEFLRIVGMDWRNDTLHFSYIKDHNLKVIANIMTRHASIWEGQHTSSSLKIPPDFLKEYQACKTGHLESKKGWAMRVTESIHLVVVPPFYTSIETPPPETASSSIILV